MGIQMRGGEEGLKREVKGKREGRWGGGLLLINYNHLRKSIILQQEEMGLKP